MGWRDAHGGTRASGEVVDLSNGRRSLVLGSPPIEDIIAGLDWWMAIVDTADQMSCCAPPDLASATEALANPRVEMQRLAWCLAGCSTSARAHVRTMLAALQSLAHDYVTHSQACPLLAHRAQGRSSLATQRQDRSTVWP